MKNTHIAGEVRRFILTSIPSVPHMEALMLLRASAPSRWSAHELSRRLYVAQAHALTVLDDLVGAGILEYEDPDGYFYSGRQAPLAELVDQLSALYRSHLVDVTMLIHSRMDRQAQQFANAFNLRKEP
jgi:DNA-binding IclR family transcriptional regulator